MRYRRGEALEVERFGRNSPVDCFWKISRPEHRNSWNSCFGARMEGRSPAGRAFWKKQSGGLFLENKPTGTPEQLEQLFRCAIS